MQRLVDGPATVNVLATPEPSTIITGLVPGLVYEFTVSLTGSVKKKSFLHQLFFNTSFFVIIL